MNRITYACVSSKNISILFLQLPKISKLNIKRPNICLKSCYYTDKSLRRFKKYNRLVVVNCRKPVNLILNFKNFYSLTKIMAT